MKRLFVAEVGLYRLGEKVEWRVRKQGPGTSKLVAVLSSNAILIAFVALCAALYLANPNFWTPSTSATC